MTKREELLHNAAKIIFEAGMQKLTMDYLAKQSNMTKGGVLYHFQSKANLLYEMNVMALESFEKMMDGYIESLTGPSIYTRAYALATLDFLKQSNQPLLPAVFISSLEDKESYLLWQETSEVWEEQFKKDTGNQDDNFQLRLLTDGVWFAILHGTNKMMLEKIEQTIMDQCEALERGRL